MKTFLQQCCAEFIWLLIGSRFWARLVFGNFTTLFGYFQQNQISTCFAKLVTLVLTTYLLDSYRFYVVSILKGCQLMLIFGYIIHINIIVSIVTLNVIYYLAYCGNKKKIEK